MAPPMVDLPIGGVYGCKLGHHTKVGQLFMVLHHPQITDSIDKEIHAWTQSYLTESIEHLKLKDNGPLKRLVVAVDRASKSVTRGVLFLLQKAKGQALVDLVDVGEMRVIPIADLFEATPAVKATKWKTVPCVLDGMNMFMGTGFLLAALNACGDLFTSTSLQLTIKGKFDSHFIVQLDDLTQANGNINEKIFDHIDNASGLRITENFIGRISQVEADGQVNIIKQGVDVLQPLDYMDRFLRTFSFEFLQAILPASSPKDVDMGKVYVAQNSKDGNLHRARIIGIDPQVATIQLIDYGGRDTVKYSDLFLAQHLDQTVARLRPLGKKAYLKGIRGITEIEKARNFLMFKDWKIQQEKEFRSYEPVVSVIDPETGVNVNQTCR